MRNLFFLVLALFFLLPSLSWGVCSTYGNYTYTSISSLNVDVKMTYNGNESGICGNLSCSASKQGTYNPFFYTVNGTLTNQSSCFVGYAYDVSCSLTPGNSQNRYSYTIYYCSTQAEADSIKCSLNPSAPGCAPECDTVSTYNAVTSAGSTGFGVGGAKTCVVSTCQKYQCTNGDKGDLECGVNQILTGPCSDWFSGCSADVGTSCDIPPNDSNKVACKSQNSTANALSGKCYYTCANGQTYSCEPTEMLNSSISGHAQYKGGCSSYPPTSCTGDMTQDTTLPDISEIPAVARGDTAKFNPEDVGSSSSPSGEYAAVLAAIHDTLTHANDYYRNDSLNWDWLRSFYSNIDGPAQQQIANNTAQTNEEIDEFRKSVEIAFGELKWEQQKNNQGLTHRDSLLQTLKDSTFEFQDSSLSVFGTIYDLLSSVYSRIFSDSTYEKTAEAEQQTAADVAEIKDSLSNTNSILDDIRNKFTSLFDDSIDVPEDNLDSMYETAQNLANKRDTTLVKLDSFKVDTSKFKTDYKDLFITNATTTNSCYTFTINNETDRGLFFLPSIVVNFGNLMGFDLCAIIRAVIRACGFILCLLITLSSYRAAFASTTND